MKPNDVDEMCALLASKGYTFNFKSLPGIVQGMLVNWPTDATLLSADEAYIIACRHAQEYGSGRSIETLHFLNEGGLFPARASSIDHSNWPVFRVGDTPEAFGLPGSLSEADRLFRFFFPNMKMSDPSKLPAAPKTVGRSWDDLADD